MASRHEIVQIDFRANAGRANPAIESLREAAKGSRLEMEKLNKLLADGKASGAAQEHLDKLNRKLTEEDKKLKAYVKSERELIKGVEALTRGIEAFNNGTLEKMSAAQQKTIANAARLARSKMSPNSEEEKKSIAEMDALILATDKNLIKARADMDQLVQSIANGGKVSAAELSNAQQMLKELSQLTAHGSAEWQTYHAQLQVVEKGMKDMGIAERQLAGEIVTGADARRAANYLTKEGHELAMQEIADARQKAETARQEQESLSKARETRLANLQTMAAELEETRDQIALKKNELEKQRELNREIKETAEQQVEATKKQKKDAVDNATTQQKAYEETRAKVKGLTEEVRDLDKEIAKLNEQKVKPNPVIEGVNREATEAEEKLERLKKSLQRIQNMKSDAQAGIDSAKEILGGDGKQFFKDERLQNALNEDRIAQEKNIEKLNAKWEEYWNKQEQKAQEFAALLKKASIDDVEWDEFHQHVAGPNAELAKAWYRVDRRNTYGIDYWHPESENGKELTYLRAAKKTGIASDSQLEELKVLENLKRKAEDYWRTQEKIRNDTPKYNAVYEELDKARSAYVENESKLEVYNKHELQLQQEIAEQEKIVAEQRKKTAETTKESTDTDEKRAELDRKLADKKRELAEAEKQLNEQEQKTITANQEETAAVRANEQATKNLAQVKTDAKKANMEGQQALERLTAEEGKHAEAVKKEQAGIDEINKKYAEQSRIIMESEAKQRAAAVNSENSMRKIIATLEEENKGLDENDRQRRENINIIEETKVKLAILRGEIISVTDAMKMAEETGSGAFSGTEKDIERAIATLQRSSKTASTQPGADGLSEYDRQTEAVEKLKQKLAELRKEVMSVADAERIAGEAMQEQARTEKTGWAAATEELKRAEQVLADKVVKAKRGTKEEEAEYQILVQKLQAVRTELNGGSISGEKMMAVLKNPESVTNIEKLKQAISRARGELNALGDRIDLARSEGRMDDVERLQKTYDDLAESVKKADVRQKELANTSKASASSFDKAWSRLKTYIGLYVGAAVAMQKLTSTMGDVMELSDKMGEVRKTTDFTTEQVGYLSEQLKKLDVRTSLTSLMDLSVAAGQLGLKTEEDVIGFTEAANKLMVALPEMGKEGATEMLKVALATGEIDKIRKQMEEGLIEGSSATAVAMEKVGSTIDRLRATSAATAPAITDFVKRVGAVGAQSGISIDQVAALGSTVDALGMRVEMSATALSRMMPAIRNNAFSVAKAIHVTPETLRNLFDTGRGMEAILMIFQHIKDNNMNADSIESMLGMAGMKEIMKELNQQGARAGIVFGGLSQNVDTLRRQLDVASEAYERNDAIQKEFEKMNDTTAAKWERLKNQIEEFFVGDTAQRWLGGIIDGLRYLVDFLTGNVGPILKVFSALSNSLIALYAAFKIGLGEALLIKTGNGIKFLRENVGHLISRTREYIKLNRELKAAQTEQAKAAAKAEMAQKGLNKTLMANVWMAVAAAVLVLVMRLYRLYHEISLVSNEMGELDENIRKQTKASNDLFYATTKTNIALEKARQRLEEVKKSGGDTAEAEKELASANVRHAESIRAINSKYGEYLGYILSETTRNEQLAKARDLVNAKIREKLTLMQKEAALGNVEREYGGNVNKKAAEMEEAVRRYFGDNDEAAARVSIGISEAAEKFANAPDKFRNALSRIIKDNEKFINKKTSFGVNMLNNESLSSAVARSILSSADDYRKEVEAYNNQVQIVTNRFSGRMSVERKNSREKAVNSMNQVLADWRDLLANYQKAEGEEKKKLAAEVYKQQRNYANLFANNSDYFVNDKRTPYFEKNIKNMATYEKSLRKVAGEAIRAIDAAERAETKITGTDFTNGGESANSPWGQPLPASSTRYADMNADVLVNRRKQMNEFVRSIQTDSDVESVLAEDEALRAAIEKGMSKDMRTVVEWYNTERLKIQDELHRRHLTNTGDWMDPKASRARKRLLRSELKAFLEELDAYYTERKTKIEEERNNEEITEGEAWRRQIKNDDEWYTRRAELQKLYAEKSGEVTEKEQTAIFDIIAERTGDTADFIRKSIGKTIDLARSIGAKGEQGAKEYREWLAWLGLGEEKDYLKAAKAVGREVKFIQDTLAKERPYDGITKNLQENLEKMGILTRDLHEANEKAVEAGLPKPYDNDAIMKATNERLAFLLGEAADAYGKDINWIMHRMGEENMQAWADSIAGSSLMKQALMGQLHAAYDAVQEAIKKEANQLRKQVDIQWNDDTLGPNGKSRKSMFDLMIATLGIQQDAVSRANSLIGAGAASENVAARIAMKQIEVQMRMQRAQYDMLRVKAQQRMQDLKEQEEEHRRIAEQMREQNNLAEAARHETEADNAMWDAQNVKKALGLTLSEETKKEQEQLTELMKLQEESQNRLYRALKEWADLLSGSLQTVFEASNAGNAEYYNELAKLRLTGKGGPGAGTFVVIENSGTENAQAHYEYLSERESLERHHEIERENALADAWKKVMDDINMKMSEAITDQINAILQNASIDTNTDALDTNTKAILGLTEAISEQGKGAGVDLGGGSSISEPLPEIDDNNPDTWPRARRKRAGLPVDRNPHDHTGNSDVSPVFLDPSRAGDTSLFFEQAAASAESSANRQIEAINKADLALQEHFHNQVETAKDANKKTQISTQSMFAKMTAAANLYGIAYQAMSNSNLSTTQRLEMVAVQAAGNAAIAMLTADLSQSTGEVASTLPAILAKCLKINPIGGAAIFAVLSAMIGGLMGMAMSKITKSKSEIAQATGASGANAGRLTTGMLAYAEGNVNEFTDPSTLKEGRQYNVDAADGRTYRARYMGRNPRTHITSGPEFHLSGERGREMIIDANTTRQITMNDGDIWHAIQTISNHRMRSGIRRGRGVRAFADGNVEDFTEMADAGAAGGVAGISVDMAVALQASIDRQSDLLERALRQGIKGVFRVDGPDGLVNTYDKGKALATKHGQKYP